MPALVAAGAVVTVQGADGRRDLPVEEIATGPGQTSLAKGDIVTSFFLRREGWRFRKSWSVLSGFRPGSPSSAGARLWFLPP